MSKIKILQIVVTMGRGGIETMLMNHLRLIDKTKFQIDFLVHGNIHGEYEDEIRALGSQIHRVRAVRKPWDLWLWRRELYRIFKEGKYDGVHSHLEQESRIILKEAKRAGVPLRIAHSHSTNSLRGPLKKAVCKWIELTTPWEATHFFGCSHWAGEWLFGKDITASPRFTFFRNAIDIHKFQYSEDARAKLRTKFNFLQTDTILGHVGRMTPEKNHIFMLELIRKLPSQYKLLFVGDGPLKPQIQQKISEYNLSERVTLTGSIADTATYYQGMDIFILPSLFEGLPVVGIEAQSAGLPCFFAKAITPELKVTPYAEYLPQDIDVWTQKIYDTQPRTREVQSLETSLEDWDVHCNTLWLENFYEGTRKL